MKSFTRQKTAPSLMRNAISNWMPLGTNIIIKFVLIPFLIAHLGTARYGVWILVSSFVGYYGLLRLDVGSGVMRYVPFYAGQGRHEEVAGVISTAMAVYGSVGIVVLLVSTLMAAPIARFYGGNAEFEALVRLTGLAASVECIMRIYEVSLRAFEKWISANIVIVTVSLLQAAGLALCVYNGLGLFHMGLVVLAATVLTLLLMVALFRISCRDIRLSVKGISLEHLKSLSSFGILTTIITLVGTFRIQGHELIIGKMISVESVAIYAVAGWLIKDARAFVVAPNRVFWPRFAWLDGGNKTRQVASLLIRSTKINAVISSAIVLVIMTAGPAFIKLWVGGGFESVFGPLKILAIAVLIETSLTSTGMLLAGTGRQRAQALIMLAEGIIGIGLGIGLVPTMGLAGMALGYLVSVALMRGVVCVIYVCRLFDISFVSYYVDTLLRPWLILFALAEVVRIAGIAAHLNSWISLVAFASVLCIVYAFFVFTIGIDAPTRREFVSRLRQTVLPLLARTRTVFANPADIDATD